MDKTLGNTLYTADQTRQPYSSAYSMGRSNYAPSVHQQSRVSHNSHISGHSNTRSNANERQSSYPRDFMVYCPVCRKQYRNSQIQYHAAVHDQSSRFDFKVKVPDYLDTTQDSVISTGFMYPMVEPLQFYTNELSDSLHNDNFIYQGGQNYDGVDRSLFTQSRDIEVQTLSRPPLQYQSENTDFYNCLDNAVNSGKGPKFSFKDIFGKNQGVTPKRDLDEWERMQIDPNQKFLRPSSKKTRW